MNIKSIFASKTLWFNLIVGLSSALTYLNPELLSSIGVAPASQTKLLAIAGLVTGIVNFVLRTYTKTAVAVNPSTTIDASVTK